MFNIKKIYIFLKGMSTSKYSGYINLCARVVIFWNLLVIATYNSYIQKSQEQAQLQNPPMLDTICKSPLSSVRNTRVSLAAQY